MLRRQRETSKCLGCSWASHTAGTDESNCEDRIFLNPPQRSNSEKWLFCDCSQHRGFRVVSSNDKKGPITAYLVSSNQKERSVCHQRPRCGVGGLAILWCRANFSAASSPESQILYLSKPTPTPLPSEPHRMFSFRDQELRWRGINLGSMFVEQLSAEFCLDFSGQVLWSRVYLQFVYAEREGKRKWFTIVPE